MIFLNLRYPNYQVYKAVVLQIKEKTGFLYCPVAIKRLVNNLSLICLIQLGELNKTSPHAVSVWGSICADF